MALENKSTFKGAANAPKVQRIKMRLNGHPVKLDGTLIEFAPDGKSFVVEFDGPVPTTKFWLYGRDSKIVLDVEPVPDRGAPAGAQVWEVL